MFRGKTIHDYYRECETKIQKEVVSKSDEDILGLDTTEYTEYLFAKYALIPVQRDESKDIEVELIRKTEEYTDTFGDRGRREVSIAQVEYPIIPHSHANTVLNLLPSSQRTVLPKFDIHPDRLTILVRLPFLYTHADSPPTGSREINSALENIEWWINSRNEDIEQLNSKLNPQIAQFIESRKEYVKRTRTGFESLVQQVHFPLKL